MSSILIPGLCVVLTDAPVIICPQASAFLHQKNVYVICEVRARPRVNLLFWTLDINGTTVTEGEVINEYWTLVKVRQVGCVC